MRRAWVIVTMFIFMLSGCGLFGGEKATKEIDPPKDVTYVEDEKALQEQETAEKEKAIETVQRELYLIDKNGFVVPQTFALPKTNAAAKQVLEYLVENGRFHSCFRTDFVLFFLLIHKY